MGSVYYTVNGKIALSGGKSLGFMYIGNIAASAASSSYIGRINIWSWGRNDSGQLGDNTVISRTTPVSVLGIKKTFNVFGAGAQYFMGIDKNGQVWGWGDNGMFQLGDNSNTSRRTPVSILGAKKTFCLIGCGSTHAMAIDKNGQLWGWGSNLRGQIGDNTNNFPITPVSVVGTKKTFCKISGGANHTAAIDKNGQVWCWGNNVWGNLGNNTVTTTQKTPVSIWGNKKTFCKISGGANHTVAIDKNGLAWGWGYNSSGQLGNNKSNTSALTPVSVLGVRKTFCTILGGNTHTTALDKNGQLWGWGYNNDGQLGDNTNVSKRTPVSILGTKKTFCRISTQYKNVMAIDKNGQVWGWGYNYYGGLGDNTKVYRCTPVRVCNL